MGTLTNTKIKDTYDGLLKTSNNNNLPATGQANIEDGLGNASAISIGQANNGLDVTGNITVSGTVDGRNIATDGTKLDGIEAGAQVNDIDGSGTANKVAKWSDSDTLTNSLIYDSGSYVGINYTSPAFPLHVNGAIYTNTGLNVGGTGTANRLDDYEEGTHTPTWNVSWTDDYGYIDYTKVGRVCQCSVNLDQYDTNSISNSPLTMTLPFAAKGFQRIPIMTLTWGGTFPSTAGNHIGTVYLYLINNSTTVYFYAANNNGSSYYLTPFNLNGDAFFDYYGFSYQTQ